MPTRVALGTVFCLALACSTPQTALSPPGGVPQDEPAPSQHAEPCEKAYEPKMPEVRRTPDPYDRDATLAALERLRNTLSELASKPGFALGHQDTTAYGVGWNTKPDTSDVKLVCGSHAAVHGWEVFGIENGDAHNADGVPFDGMRQLITDAHLAGAINTVSWHAHNPVTQGNAWETSRAVERVLPGGSHHRNFVRQLDRLANFFQTLAVPGKERIPLIFRPWHEHSGSWFWWGKSHTSEEDFIALWRFTADYLRRERGLDHLLFAFSPSGGDATSVANYLYGYPGDDYVDVLGIDHYYHREASQLVRAAELLVRVARERNKIAAITEFGAQDGLHKQQGYDWLNESFLGPLRRSSEALGIAYALAWRNARADHHFLPHPGHPAEKGFRAFCAAPEVFLLSDMPSPQR